MKTFQSATGELFAYEIDGTQDDLIATAKKTKWKELSDNEVFEILNPKPNSDQIISGLINSVQAHIDVIAKSIGYDDIYTACTYAEEPAVPRFQIEGRALRAWRSLVWAKCHEVMAEVTNGKREIPTDEQLIALLPNFTIPKA